MNDGEMTSKEDNVKPPVLKSNKHFASYRLEKCDM